MAWRYYSSGDTPRNFLRHTFGIAFKFTDSADSCYDFCSYFILVFQGQFLCSACVLIAFNSCFF